MFYTTLSKQLFVFLIAQNDQINANQDMREKLKDDLWVEFQKTLKKGKEKGMRLKKIHFSKLLLEHLEWCK